MRQERKKERERERDSEWICVRKTELDDMLRERETVCDDRERERERERETEWFVLDRQTKRERDRYCVKGERMDACAWVFSLCCCCDLEILLQ